MGKVIMSGIVPKLVEPSAGIPVGDLAVGSPLFINVNGVPKEFFVVHKGLPSSDYDGSCNGVWVLMKEIYELRQWHSAGTGQYANAEIHSYLNGAFLGLLDSGVQNAILQAKIPYRTNGSGGSNVTGANGLSAKVFLLSDGELGVGYSGAPSNADSNQYLPKVGSALSYFQEWTPYNPDYGGQYSSEWIGQRKAQYKGEDTGWWTRSPRTYDTTTAFYVNINGGLDAQSATKTYGVRPALILPHNAVINDEGVVVG